MNTVNAVCTAVGDFIFRLLSFLPPWAVLLVVSIVCGVLMTLVFRKTSKQAALRRVVKRTRAQLMCMRLFKDDFRVALSCQREVLKGIGARLWYSLPPMLVMIIPFALVLAQLATRFEKQPITVHESAVVVLDLVEPAWATNRNVALHGPSGVRAETPGLRDARDHTVTWRISATVPVDDNLRWSVGGTDVQKSIVCAEDANHLAKVSPRRPGTAWWDRLLYPAERGFGDGDPVRAIQIHYPSRSTPILGLDIPWWATFIIASMLAALLVRPFLRVQF